MEIHLEVNNNIINHTNGTKHTAHNVSSTGDPGLIPGSWRSLREGTGFPLEYSWATLTAQSVKGPPAMWESWVRWSPGGGHYNPLQYSRLENPHGEMSLAGYSPWGHKKSDTTERLSTACGPCEPFFFLSLSLKKLCSDLGMGSTAVSLTRLKQLANRRRAWCVSNNWNTNRRRWI